MIYSLNNLSVTFNGKPSFIAENATVIGNVTFEENSSVWYNVVIRGDGDHIHIGANTNIQDASVLHVDPGFPLTIGNGVTIGHKVMLHGCIIGDGTLVGINAVVLNGAKIGKNCLIGANALIPENMEVPDGSLVVGSPGKIKRVLSEEQQAMLAINAEHYVQNGKVHNQHLQRDLELEAMLGA